MQAMLNTSTDSKIILDKLKIFIFKLKTTPALNLCTVSKDYLISNPIFKKKLKIWLENLGHYCILNRTSAFKQRART